MPGVVKSKNVGVRRFLDRAVRLGWKRDGCSGGGVLCSSDKSDVYESDGGVISPCSDSVGSPDGMDVDGSEWVPDFESDLGMSEVVQDNVYYFATGRHSLDDVVVPEAQSRAVWDLVRVIVGQFGGHATSGHGRDGLLYVRRWLYSFSMEFLRRFRAGMVVDRFPDIVRYKHILVIVVLGVKFDGFHSELQYDAVVSKLFLEASRHPASIRRQLCGLEPVFCNRIRWNFLDVSRGAGYDLVSGASEALGV